MNLTQTVVTRKETRRTAREIRTPSINVAGVLLMNGIEPLGTIRHFRTGALMVCFPGTPEAQELLNQYNAARDRASEMLNEETPSHAAADAKQ